jgi:hypothetical protein
VACLLDHGARRKLWDDLQAGKEPEEAREDVLHDAPPPELGETAEAEAAG